MKGGVSAILVSYRSASLATAAIGSLRKEAESADLPLEVIAVVNSGDEAERTALRRVADTALLPSRNLGYAGGLNLGLSEARFETLLFCNPDLVLKPGALARLVAPLSDGGLVMTGPAFFWDDDETLHLPPAEEPRLSTLLRRELLARGRDRGAVFRRDARRARVTAAAVRRGETVPATALSGALMVTTREALAAVGPFDEAFPLYFEENDWQHRLRARGGRLLVVSAARVVHRYNQSARSEPSAAAWFAESEHRYYSRHVGPRGEEALERLWRVPAVTRPALLDLPEGTLTWERPDQAGSSFGVAVAVSPTSTFHPFAYAPLTPRATSFTLPPAILRGIQGESWFLRAFNPREGSVLAEGRLQA